MLALPIIWTNYNRPLTYVQYWYSDFYQDKPFKGMTHFFVNEELLFSHPLKEKENEGHFGLRLLSNHVLFTGFQVKQDNLKTPKKRLQVR